MWIDSSRYFTRTKIGIKVHEVCGPAWCDWYKSRAYRSRMVHEPRAVLAEFGTEIADDVEVRVHDSTADLRFIVLPVRPEGTEQMDEADLADLVTRDCMIGVSVPKGTAA